LQHQIAIDRLRADLTKNTTHARDVITRWQFRSRRAPVVPMFVRRYTA